ncbi:MAG TPA: histidine kinase [Methylibium sp.]|uniref:sensor histidine kinase n=1 Tax=Methylibium sp. TaxID=2067992 RepID=UPI002DB59B46|nr:histidine kinase [Methylibium sp.]HEU4460304.1 histidine kinase [Methylibium sp.]
MSSSAASSAAAPGRWLEGLGPSRIGLALAIGSVAALALNPIFVTPFWQLWARGLLIALALTLAYTLAGNWRQTKVPRWHVQILAVVLLAPVCAAIDGLWDSGGSVAELLANRKLVLGFVWITFSSLGIGLLVTMLALIREREAQVNAQALRFALERETLERQALDARLRLMTAQIEPHFLLNTLANVQALVEGGSPRAAPVLQSLIAYLRAAMPRLRSVKLTLGDELALVRAYLEVMGMRIPDRLSFAIDVPEALHAEPFPSMALLTLVENAVRHGIDPAEAGGRIEVGARRIEADGSPLAGGLHVWVEDSGVGLDATAPPGQGLANLRERVAAFYGPAARLALSEPRAAGASGGRGLRAELRLPPPRATAADAR